MTTSYTYYLGVDLGGSEHVCVLWDEEEVVGQITVEHSGKGLAHLVEWLAEEGAEPGLTAAGAERPHGAVVESLLDHGYDVYAINPKQVDRFRDRRSPSGAKDDGRDATIIGGALRTDLRCFKRVRRSPDVFVRLRELDRRLDQLEEDEGRDANRMTDALRSYFPQLLALCPSGRAVWFRELVERAPTPEAARTLSREEIEGLLGRYGVKKVSVDDVLEAVGQPPVPARQAVVESRAQAVLQNLERLELTARQIREVKKEISALKEELAETLDEARDEKEEKSSSEGHPSDLDILSSFPGIGCRVLAALVGEAGHLLVDRDLESLRTLTGVAPVTRASGKRHRVVMRRACKTRLRNACFHWARTAVREDELAAKHYGELTARGKEWARALRSVADRLLRLLIGALKSRTIYDPAKIGRVRSRPVAA